MSHLTAFGEALTNATSRRGVLARLSGGVLAAAAFGRNDDAGARKKGKRKERKKKKDRSTIRPDAQCADANGAAVDSTPDGRIAQTFTAIRGGALVRTEAEFNKPTGSLGDFILHLAPVDAFGFPTNQVLANASLTSAQVPDGLTTVAKFTFPQPATVKAGVPYALVLSRPEVGIVGWRGRLDDGCAGRAFSSDDRTGPFVGAGQSVDLIFTTFVRS